MNKKITFYRSLFVLMFAFLVGVAVNTAYAQSNRFGVEEGQSGGTYLIAFPDTSGNTIDARYQDPWPENAAIMIYSGVNQNIKVKLPSGGEELVKLIEKKFYKYDIIKAGKPVKGGQPLIVMPNVNHHNIYRIEADFPIVVYCMLDNKFGSEAWTPLPAESWGTDYYTVGVPGEPHNNTYPAGEFNYDTKPREAPAEFVIACLDSNTAVSITDPTYPSEIVVHRYDPPETQMAFFMHQDEARLVETWVDTLSRNLGVNQSDGGGMRISSDKPIGIISGNSRSLGGLTSSEVRGLAKNTMRNMLMEAVAPIEAHGREFVYMPSLDSRKPQSGPPPKNGGVRNTEYARVYGTTRDYNGKSSDFTNIEHTTPSYPNDGKMMNNQVKLGQGTPVASLARMPNQNLSFEPRSAYIIKTDKPAQATKISTAVTYVVSQATNGAGTYNSWSPYMTEMIPREQWITFAPAFTPAGDYESYLNIVTDSNSRNDIELVFESGATQKLNINKPIAGSDLYWTSVRLNPDTRFVIRSANGNSKFCADVFGISQGEEWYLPGTAKDGDKKGAETQGGSKDKVMHPSDYSAKNAHAYGYPVAPNRWSLGPQDSLELEIKTGCDLFEVHATLLGGEKPKAAGFRAIRLIDAKNAKIVWINPTKATGIIGASEVTFRVAPIDPTQNAEATVEVVGKTGQVWRIPYLFEAEKLDIQPKQIDFGETSVGAASSPKEIIITNTLKKSVIIKEVKLERGNQDFEIVGYDPSPLPITLAEGQVFKIQVRINPKQENPRYVDFLKVITECSELKVPLLANGTRPCIHVDNLDFKTMRPNESRTLPLQITNVGKGTLTFDDPNSPGGKALTWFRDNAKYFTVSDVDLAKLRVTKLQASESVTITVKFTADTVLGYFTTLGKFWTNADCIRDTSIWEARVVQPGPDITGYDWKNRWVVSSLNTCTKSGTQDYVYDSVSIGNSGTQSYTVKSLELVGQDATDGYFTLGDRPKISVGDVLQGNDLESRRYQQVIFKPKDEREYRCLVRLTTMDDAVVEASLVGVGIESHVAITGHDFDTTEFIGSGQTIVKGSVMLNVKPTRVTTITGLNIIGADKQDYDFDIRNDFSLPTVSTPWVMNPGDEKEIPLLFRPLTPGVKRANIEVLSDHSRCDDSVNTLIGYSYFLGAKAEGFNFNNLLTCDDQKGTTKITNTGSADIIVTNIDLNGDGSVFILEYPKMPFKLAPGETVTVPVTFVPRLVGNYSATVVFGNTDEFGKRLPDQSAELTGKAHLLVSHGYIKRDYHCQPGEQLNIPVTLEDPLDEATSKDILINIKYAAGMMQLVNSAKADVEGDMTRGTLLEGWNAEVKENVPGVFTVAFTNSNGGYLKGAGTLLNLKFTTYVGDVMESEIPWYMILQDRRNCTEVRTDPGFAYLDSICGLNLRLIEMITGNYALKPNVPNPFNPSTDIEFQVALDAPTSLVIYNEEGRKVATLVNQYLKPGTYKVTWDATAFPSGLYYYRLTSGHWSKTNSMTLQK